MYPNIRPDTTQPSNTSMPPSRSNMSSQPQSQNSTYPGGQSSLPPYPTAPSLSNAPYPPNANNFTLYSLPNVGQQSGAYQGGNNPYPPPYPGFQQQQQQQQQYPPMNMMNNQNPQQTFNPYQLPQGGYPGNNPYQQQFPNSYPPPYGQQFPGGYPQNDPPRISAGGFNSNIYDNRLREICQKYEISDVFAQRLNILQQFEVIILCDDSGSMNTPVDGTTRTRWDELRTIVQIIVEIGTVFDSNGVDVHFLNRPATLNVTSPGQIMESFSKPPKGLTPLTTALRRIFQSGASKSSSNKNLLVFIATDGAPTDKQGNVDIRSLENLMRNERQVNRVYVTFLACTDDEAAVKYLSEWDRTMVNVDVVDDYKTEREEIRRVNGPNYPFSFGDYVVKALIGAVDAQMDALDEGRR